ncbi:MAG: type II secretion system minor pseudopilin GspH [Magnetococcales bacterium]|nr:type II secretion system minor pseudopilin GspH [Magnetococcales bacterium]
MTFRRKPTGAAQQGFTLMEVMVVTVIIAVLSGVAMMAIGQGGPERAMEEEVKRLAVRLEYAANEAILTGRPHGVELTQRQYRFLAMIKGEWKPMDEGEREAKPRTLSEVFHFELDLNGLVANLPEAHDDQLPPAPQIVLRPTGERTVFNLRVRQGEGQGYQLSTDPLGEWTVEPFRHDAAS